MSIRLQFRLKHILLIITLVAIFTAYAIPILNYSKSCKVILETASKYNLTVDTEKETNIVRRLLGCNERIVALGSLSLDDRTRIRINDIISHLYNTSDYIKIISLNATHINTDQDIIDYISICHNIKELRIVASDKYTIDINFSKMPLLTRINLSASLLSRKTLASISTVQGLVVLDLTHTNTTDTDMKSFLNLFCLEEINLSFTKTGINTLRLLLELPSVKDITMRDTNVTSSDLKQLDNLIKQTSNRIEHLDTTNNNE